MLKRTLFFSNPYRLSLKDRQLVVTPINNQMYCAVETPYQGVSNADKTGNLHKETPKLGVSTVPVEDIACVVLEHNQIQISLPVLDFLNENNVAILFCNNKHMPSSMLLNLDGHHLQGELFRHQMAASEPLKKNLWKQTIEAKIRNQAAVLDYVGKQGARVRTYATQVKSGDVDNREGAAAREYWRTLFGEDFIRDRYGLPPNNLLNYGYIILRAAVARALAGSGMLATLGIHHHNRYNAFCLADDIMEPYRAYVDMHVYQLWESDPDCAELTTEHKAYLLQMLTCDVHIGKHTRPLMVALSQTTASLARCFSGETKKIVYPKIE